MLGDLNMWVLGSPYLELSHRLGTALNTSKRSVSTAMASAARYSVVKAFFDLLHSEWAQPWAWLHPCPAYPALLPLGVHAPVAATVLHPHYWAATTIFNELVVFQRSELHFKHHG